MSDEPIQYDRTSDAIAPCCSKFLSIFAGIVANGWLGSGQQRGQKVATRSGNGGNGTAVAIKDG
jgi:hypothetical protein